MTLQERLSAVTGGLAGPRERQLITRTSIVLKCVISGTVCNKETNYTLNPNKLEKAIAAL